MRALVCLLSCFNRNLSFLISNRQSSTTMKRNYDKMCDSVPTFSRSPAEFSLLSWNLDGLDGKNIQERTEFVVDLLEKRKYSIVMLQELIPVTFAYIASRTKSIYRAVLGTNNPSSSYFTATFLRNDAVRYVDHQIINFPGTVMDRNLLVTQCQIGNTKLAICNTHLESTASFAAQRIVQLKTCFERCCKFSPEWNVIFGGDLNARDNEVQGKIPSNMYDVWMKCGSNESSKYTWDLRKNTNKQMPGKKQPQCRFDRLYFRESVPGTVKPEFFGLTGLDMVKGTESYPSDHWGVVAFFQTK